MRTLALLFVLAITGSIVSCARLDNGSQQDKQSTIHTMDQEKTAATKAPTVVFMGNSITQSWPDFTPGFWSKPAYINRGIGGQTTDELLDRFERDVIEVEPDAVVILAGTNDIAQNNGPVPLEAVRDNIIEMCQQADEHGIRVILCSILPAMDYPWRPGLEPAEKIVRVNAWLRAYAKEMEISYVDFHSKMSDDQNGMIPELAYDGVHPNENGYQLMVEILKNAETDLFGG